MNTHGGAGRGQGRKAGYKHQTVVKNRIKAGVLMDRLYKCAQGEIEMTATQLTAALGFLRKVIPDLKAVEHSGQVTHRHVEEMTDAELFAVIARGRSAGTADEAASPGEPAELH